MQQQLAMLISKISFPLIKRDSTCIWTNKVIIIDIFHKMLQAMASLELYFHGDAQLRMLFRNLFVLGLFYAPKVKLLKPAHDILVLTHLIVKH